jgi:hypothetical protein
MSQSKPLVGAILIVAGSILVYIGWKGLGIVTDYVANLKAALP